MGHVEARALSMLRPVLICLASAAAFELRASSPHRAMERRRHARDASARHVPARAQGAGVEKASVYLTKLCAAL